MPATIPGLGVATPIADLLANYRDLVRRLPAVIEQYPDARVVRVPTVAQTGNLTLVIESDGSVDCIGYIDVRTGDIELYDEPQPVGVAD